MQGIILQTIRYGDNQMVAHILTETEGRRSYLVATSRGRHHDGVAAALQPLSLVSFEPGRAKTGTMARVSQMHIAEPYARIPFDNTRRSICMFLTELLCKSVPQDVPDPYIYEFVRDWLLLLDSEVPGVFNLHLVFMMRLAAILGFGPDPEREGAPFFDLQSGEWVAGLPAHRMFLSGHLADVWHSVLCAEVAHLPEVCTALDDRRNILRALEAFFRIHHPGFGELMSLKVLMS